MHLDTGKLASTERQSRIPCDELPQSRLQGGTRFNLCTDLSCLIIPIHVFFHHKQSQFGLPRLQIPESIYAKRRPCQKWIERGHRFWNTLLQ